jgi:hypothetical protein
MNVFLDVDSAQEITVTHEALFSRRLPRIRQGTRRNLYVTGRHGPTATKGTVR